ASSSGVGTKHSRRLRSSSARLRLTKRRNLSLWEKRNERSCVHSGQTSNARGRIRPRQLRRARGLCAPASTRSSCAKRALLSTWFLHWRGGDHTGLKIQLKLNAAGRHHIRFPRI